MVPPKLIVQESSTLARFPVVVVVVVIEQVANEDDAKACRGKGDRRSGSSRAGRRIAVVSKIPRLVVGEHGNIATRVLVPRGRQRRREEEEEDKSDTIIW